MTELCHCGHELHTNACRKPVLGSDHPQICACPQGQRVDLATFRVLVDLTRIAGSIEQTLVRILAVAETATGLQSKLVRNKEGDGAHVEVQKREAAPKILIPR